MKHYLDENTRVVLKWHLSALGYVFALQRHKCYGWRTVSWIYPSVVKSYCYEYVIHWLLWKEEQDKGPKGDLAIGKSMMGNAKQKSI